MNENPLLYLSADDVRTALPMPAAIEAARDAFEQLGHGQVSLPTRECLTIQDRDGVDLVMPCASSASAMFSLKTVTVFHDNKQRGLPTTQGLLVLTDGETGSHRAIMDGTSLTAIRTGAASGLATDLFAQSDASSVAIFGAGVQARTQLEAVCCVRPISRATVFTPGSTSADRFAVEMTERLGVPVRSVDSPAECVADTDVICTATSSVHPVLADADVRNGVHINAVGAYRPDLAEVPAETIRRGRVVVDHLESAMEEAGDLLQPMQAGVIEAAHFSTQLSDVLLGRASGRSGPEEITIFKSVGVAIQDLCAATRVLERARQSGLGTPLS